MELVSGNGAEERDATPRTGKFWIYERLIKGKSYAIVDQSLGTLEVHRLKRGRYQLMRPNSRGHYWAPELGAALGLWRGTWACREHTWPRWFTKGGKRIRVPTETAPEEAARAARATARADRQAARALRAEEEATRARRAEDQANQKGRATGGETSGLGDRPQPTRMTRARLLKPVRLSLALS